MRDDEHEFVYDAVFEVWRDTSDPMDETFDEWAHWTIRSDAVRPVALVPGASPATSSRASRSAAQDPNDPNAGYVGTLGVRRPWRKQGLGEALLLHSFAAFRERGWARGTLGVDAASPTGATRLYERAGMRVYRDTAFFERPVRA